MNLTTLLLGVVALIVLIIAYIRGPDVAADGLLTAGRTLWRNLLLLLFGFAIAGLVQALLPEAVITQWLGAQAGFKGILIACAAGGLIPGTPYAVFPLAASLYAAGAGIGPMVGFVSAWALWSVSRLPVEIAIIGAQPALIRYAVTFAMPPLAGLLAGLLVR